MADEINTVPEMLQYRWQMEPDSKWFNYVNAQGPVSSLTAGQIYTLAGRFALRLRQYGFEDGDVVANGIPNSPERLVTDMGVLMAGCVLVNCQVVEKDGSNFFNVANTSRCCGVIIPHRENNESYQLLAPFISSPTVTTSVTCSSMSTSNAPTLTKVVIVNREAGKPENSMLDMLRSSDDEIYYKKPSPSDLAVLFGTSGSTGFSKLVPFRHETIFQYARVFPALKGITSFTDRPAGWIGGFPFDCLAYGSERFAQDQFDGLQAKSALELWSVIARTGCQGGALLPGAIYELVDLLKDNPPEFKLQFITTGGQCMKRDLVSALGLLCKAIVVSYGSTETGITHYKVITDPSQFEEFQCGQPVKDVQVKIVDDNGKDIEVNNEGNLLIKSPRVFPHYFNLDTKSQAGDVFTPDGFFRTGDRAKVDADGNLYCFGRSGDVVSMGIFLIYLSWPESILSKCPLLQDSAVVGFQEKNGNPCLSACVVPRLGQEVSASKVMDYFEGALVDNAHRSDSMPTLSNVFVMESLPLLPSGKINKRRLKQFVEEKLGR